MAGRLSTGAEAVAWPPIAFGAQAARLPDEQEAKPQIPTSVDIENLANLEAMSKKRTVAAALPPPIGSLEGVVIRVVALVQGKGGLNEAEGICHPPPSRSGAV